MFQLRPGVLSRAAVDAGSATPTKATLDGPAFNGTLSGGNLTFTKTVTTLGCARSKSLKNSGKWSIEFTLTDVDGSGDCVGFATDYASADDIGNTGLFCCVVFRSGAIYSNDVNTLLTVGAVADGDVIQACIDLDNDKCWFRKAPSGNWNGQVIGSQNPATNTGGVSISNYSASRMAPVVVLGGGGGQIGDTVTVNLGASAFTGAVPSGFTSGWDVRSGPEWVTAFRAGTTSTSAGWNGYTMRVLFRPAAQTYVGSQIRLTLTGPATEGTAGDAIYLGFAASSGDVYDFDGGQQQLQVSGSNSFDAGISASIVTDAASFSGDITKTILVAFHFNNAAKDNVTSGLNAGTDHYYKAAVSEAGTTNVTGYTAGPGTTHRVITKIEVYT